MKLQPQSATFGYPDYIVYRVYNTSPIGDGHYTINKILDVMMGSELLGLKKLGARFVTDGLGLVCEVRFPNGSSGYKNMLSQGLRLRNQRKRNGLFFRRLIRTFLDSLLLSKQNPG